MSDTRVCRKCGLEKPLLSFSTDPECEGGRRLTCRRCKKGKPALNPGKTHSYGDDCIPPHVEPKPEPPLYPVFERSLAKRRFLITAAQNATPVHAPFFQTLLAAAAHLDAEIVVVPIRYKNPTSIAESKKQKRKNDVWWAPEVEPYLLNTRTKLNANLVLAADIKTQPTAKSPLTGFESLTGPESCIVAHTKMQYKTVAVPSGRLPKILTTTGACTQPNYSDTKAGALGAFHHYLGALMVELDGGFFQIRQLNADREDGSFIDLDTLYTSAGTLPALPAIGLVLGDVHHEFIDPGVKRATFGRGGIVEVLNPETIVYTDVNDGYPTNPHHIGNPFISRAKMLGGLGNARDEVLRTVDFIKETSAGRKAVIVASNHDDFLARWVQRHDWKTDPVNAEFYLETALAVLQSTRLGEGGAEYADAFSYWVNAFRDDADIRCLKVDESFMLGDSECCLHGDRGPNGARGSTKNLSRLGVKVIKGHDHSPAIEEGAYGVGTSSRLRLEYNKGPSSWLNAHVVVYANGARAILSIIDGKWRVPPADEFEISEVES